jgi:hypothetical protein
VALSVDNREKWLCNSPDNPRQQIRFGLQQSFTKRENFCQRRRGRQAEALEILSITGRDEEEIMAKVLIENYSFKIEKLRKSRFECSDEYESSRVRWMERRKGEEREGKFSA